MSCAITSCTIIYLDFFSKHEKHLLISLPNQKKENFLASQIMKIFDKFLNDS